MPSHRAPKVTGRATAAAATVVGVTAGTVALLPGTSQASPTQSLSQIKSEVQQLNNQAEQKTNAYDAAQEQYAQLQKKIDGLQAQITQEQSSLDTLESTMGLQAAAQYRNGGISPTLQLALNSSPEKYLSQAGFESQQADQEAMLMRTISQEKAQLLQDRMTASNALAQQQVVLNQAKSALDGIKATLAQKKQIMNQLTAAQQQQVNSAGGTTSYSGTLPAASGRAGAAVAYAESKVGDPYVYGAAGPGSFDCSGLTSAAWAYAGVTIPRTSEGQFSGLQRFYNASQLQPGDLVFFEGDPPGHVAIYVGNDEVIHAPHTGTVVQYASLNPSSPNYIYMSVVGYARVG